jgi:hypothetical protein
VSRGSAKCALSSTGGYCNAQDASHRKERVFNKISEFKSLVEAGIVNRPKIKSTFRSRKSLYCESMTQVVFGTDFPFIAGAPTAKGLADFGFSVAELSAIDRSNAAKLIPSWRDEALKAYLINHAGRSCPNR